MTRTQSTSNSKEHIKEPFRSSEEMILKVGGFLWMDFWLQLVENNWPGLSFPPTELNIVN